MNYSLTELKVLEQIGKGKKNVLEIASALNISRSQIYRICQSLEKKRIIVVSRGIIMPEGKTHINLLLQLLSEQSSVISSLSGAGLEIFTKIADESKTMAEIGLETNLHKTTIAKKIKEGLKISLVSKIKHKYKINELIWPKAKEFLIEFKKYELSIDERIPVNSTIYYKNKEEILFSTKEFLDAELTAFSVYEKYGLKIHNLTNYYYLPKKILTKKEVFIHSLKIAEKDQETRNILFVALFYLKFKKELSSVKNNALEKIKSVLKGEKIDKFITLSEIKDRAEMYGLKV
ncbi:MAG: hypothetical protein ACP5N2_03840 [Candidatus Nanoarchaeia archaeon]